MVARVLFRIRIDGALVEKVPDRKLPTDFSPRTHYAVTRPTGDDWLEHARTPAFSVPSAIVPAERNYILNPQHPQFAKLTWEKQEPINLDDRLWSIP